MTYRTKKKHFEYFVERCKFWLDFFGLKCWEVRYFHKSREGLAGFETWQQSRTCDIYLSPTWTDVKVTIEELDASAFHEVFEIFIGPVCSMVHPSQYDEMDTRRHTIIRTMENVVLPKIRGKL